MLNKNFSLVEGQLMYMERQLIYMGVVMYDCKLSA